ncbi:MAG: DUF4294 domain-containing protein [Flavobacteriales bacterium]|nr:DUF4294 domain-containing protein [Flavobacteriales bacterium]
MKKLIIIALGLLVGTSAIAQIELPNPDSLKDYKSDAVQVYSKDYMIKYNRSKRLVLKVYPYALYAADVVDEIENNTASINRRRKKNKFYKNAYKDLKADFKYVILDMYTSEGRMLVKLIHRETGMTVYDIASKYRGKSKAKMFSMMGKIWDQDIKSEFDAQGDDKITEHVLKDIESGLIAFDEKAVILKKEDYKEGQKEYKDRVKKSKQYKKEKKKKAKEREKQNKKKKRKEKRSNS